MGVCYAFFGGATGTAAIPVAECNLVCLAVLSEGISHVIVNHLVSVVVRWVFCGKIRAVSLRLLPVVGMKISGKITHHGWAISVASSEAA